MGAALSAKRGGKSFPMAQKIAGQMSESQLEDFARKGKSNPGNPGNPNPPLRQSTGAPGLNRLPPAPKAKKAQSYL
jgi:hypothetical protein